MAASLIACPTATPAHHLGGRTLLGRVQDLHATPDSGAVASTVHRRVANGPSLPCALPRTGISATLARLCPQFLGQRNSCPSFWQHLRHTLQWPSTSQSLHGSLLASHRNIARSLGPLSGLETLVELIRGLVLHRLHPLNVQRWLPKPSTSAQCSRRCHAALRWMAT